MNNRLVVIADADCIVAQALVGDANHQRTLALGRKLQDSGALIIFPSTAVAEAVTALQRRFSDPQLAALTLQVLVDPNTIVENVDQETIQEAAKLFDPNASKQNTVFDCIVATIAKRHNADGVFSFDSWYQKLGLKLVSQLF